MRLTFHIEYYTQSDECLYITGNLPQLGAGDTTKPLPMHTTDGCHYTAEIDIESDGNPITYRYFVGTNGNIRRSEWGEPHSLLLSKSIPSLAIHDRWQDLPDDKPFYSQAFTNCICRRPEWELKPLKDNQLRLMVEAPMILPNQTVAICGSCEALGNWNPHRALRLECNGMPRWSVTIDANTLPDTPIEYKFIIIDNASGSLLGWEPGNNRSMSVNGARSMVVAGLHLENPLPLWRGAGVAIPVFSLRSESDFGVGDFYDLIDLIEWASETGQKMIQVLPINDTTMTRGWMDSYPYNANSCFALHPMYLRLNAMGTLNEPKERARFEELRCRLNSLSEVDYEAVNRAKEEYTRKLFEQQGHADLHTDSFKAFYNANSLWLKPYAAYCVLRDIYNTADTRSWGEYSVYSPSRIDRFIKEHRNETDYVYYIQYHLDRQLRHVSEVAHAHGVAIKGDIPIGISRDSVDAWISPQLFNLDMSAGAPPDDFAIMGQNWGFPTYNWEVMSQDNFAWWKARFRKMAEYFDAYRIDHVLGFFRIWQIPLHSLHGLLGYFNRALPLSPEDMLHGFDFHFNPDWMTQPYIHDEMLTEIFGALADRVKAEFLHPVGGGRYRLIDRFKTQRDVAEYFGSHHPDNAENHTICEGLLQLLDQVLFIEDPIVSNHYHPRITGSTTYAFRALDEYQQNCYNRLYHNFYYERNDDFWRRSAMWKLPPLLNATGMLVCAEDLGMIPACVPQVMDRLKMLSLEVQRMPKDPAEAFANTSRYPYLSVCTTSTHDMGGLRQWWEERHCDAQRFYNTDLHCEGEAPLQAEPWVCRRVLEMNLNAPSMLCILPLQDWLSVDGDIRRADPKEEQINFPGNSRHYWRYRMHITIESLRHADNLNSTIREMISHSGR